MYRIVVFIVIISAGLAMQAQDTVNRSDAAGRKQGFWRKSDKSGVKIYEGQFIDGHPAGEFRYYYPDGNIKTIAVMSEKGRKARTISYFPDGKKMAAGNYWDEKKDSTWLFYSEITSELASEEFYKNGLLEGVAKVFFPGGQLSEIKNYRNGVAEGAWEQYFTDGSIKLRGSMQSGERHGPYRTWYVSGQVQQTGQYNMGQPDGTWTFFNEKGGISKKEVYKDGKLEKKSEPDKK